MPESVTTALKAAMTTGLTAVQTAVGDYISAALPIALAIMGTFLAIRLAIGFFRSIAR